MSIRSSRQRQTPDALAALKSDDIAVTFSGASPNSLTLDVLNSYWQENQVAESATLRIALDVTSIVDTGTYTLAVQVASDASFSSPVTVASMPITTLGASALSITREDVEDALNGSATGYMRLYATLGGTSPSITYNAYATQ